MSLMVRRTTFAEVSMFSLVLSDAVHTPSRLPGRIGLEKSKQHLRLLQNE